MTPVNTQLERIKSLNKERIVNGDYVVYWMQASLRVHCNHALEYAKYQANKLKKPLIVYFGLTSEYPEANYRHYTFLVEGLQELEKSLDKMNIQLIVLYSSPEKGAVDIGQNASLMVTDMGYLENQRRWREYAAYHLNCPLIQVETNVIVPVETASPKEEYAAYTIRRKINHELEKFLVPLKNQKVSKSSLNLDFNSTTIDRILKKLKIDRGVDEAPYFHGGTNNAVKHLKYFIKNKLDGYADLRSNPQEEYLSNMSPYLHFGMISPLHIAIEISHTDSPGRDAYLEELIIRRELSMNFTYYNPNYQIIECLPDWAVKTLQEHENDPRPYQYTLEELENADTHDPYWNTAQKQMVYTGKMHGYMRMYWGKKILQWVQDPGEAYRITLHLNDKYELDGRDPNGYAGVAWCYGKHDRPWKEREIFGKIRYMNSKGLERKFNMDKYIDRVKGIIELIENDLYGF